MEQAVQLIQSIAQSIQHKVHSKISEVVSKCLSAVYGATAYRFKIHFDKKRGKTEARAVFVRDGHELDPLDGVGGGVLDVACFALRVICIALRQPNIQKVMICDEPFKNVNGDENRIRCAEMVDSLSKEFGLQIIMTTGYDWLKIGKIIELS